MTDLSTNNKFSVFLPEQDESELEPVKTVNDETERTETKDPMKEYSEVPTNRSVNSKTVKTKQSRCSMFSITNNNSALAVMCLCALMQNIIVGGANNAILTTIERAYFMTSLESALFLTFYDVANIIASPIIGYFGDKFYKPRILGMSMVGLSLGSLVMVVPEFIALSTRADTSITAVSTTTTAATLLSNLTNYSSSDGGDQILCSAFNSSTASSNNSLVPGLQSNPNQFLNYMKYVFYLANMINGVSSVALYTIAVSFIENIFLKDQVNVRQGVYYAIGAIGVGIGMLATGNFLNINGALTTSTAGSAAATATSRMNSSNVNFIGVIL
jgi:MFS family permease